jgi:hypothetical protein
MKTGLVKKLKFLLSGILKMKWQFLSIIVLCMALLFDAGCGSFIGRVYLPISKEGCKPFGKPAYLATKQNIEVLNDSSLIVVPFTLTDLTTSFASDTAFLFPDMIFGYAFGWRTCSDSDMPKSKEDKNPSLYKEP